MKIKQLKLKNFAKFSDFEIEFNDNITRLVGMNGSGKTTIGLNAIWACLKGIAEKSKDALIGERYRFIGDKRASADIELILKDEVDNIEIKVKNHITKQSNDIKFEAPQNYPISNDWLNNLLSVAFLSTKNFCQLSSKEQAILMGIDVSEIDKKIADEKSEYTLINRDIKAFGDIRVIEKTERVSISELIAERDKIYEYNLEQDRKDEILLKAKRELNALIDQRDELISEADDLDIEIERKETSIEEMEEGKPFKSPNEINEKIKNAESINNQAILYEAYLENKERLDKLKTKLEYNKHNQEALKRERLDFIKKFNLPFNDLEIDDNGGLMLNGRPLKEPYFSRGELELIVARLYKAKNPDLKIRFIDDFELLDDNNQEKIIDELLKDNFQIITAEIGEVSSKDNVVILRDCKIK